MGELVRSRLDPNELELGLVNHPGDTTFLRELVSDMRNVGWKGRELLVEEAGLNLFQTDVGPTHYVAWTGSHRITAAIAAGLEQVPCAVIPREVAHEAFSAIADLDKVGFNSWREVVESNWGPFDGHKLAALQEVGLRDAAELMHQEAPQMKPIPRSGTIIRRRSKH